MTLLFITINQYGKQPYPKHRPIPQNPIPRHLLQPLKTINPTSTYITTLLSRTAPDLQSQSKSVHQQQSCQSVY